MEFKYALSILFSNMGYILKILLWILICVLLVASIGAAILVPIFHVLATETNVMTDIQSIQNDITDLANPESSNNIVTFFKSITLHFSDVLTQIATCPGVLVGLIFTAIFLYLLYNFMIGFSYLPVADIVNKIMSSNLKFGLASNMALNFKKSIKFSLARLVISIPINIVFFGIIFGIATGLFASIKMFAIPILVILTILCYIFRSMIFAGWLPRILFNPDEKLFTSFSKVCHM